MSMAHFIDVWSGTLSEATLMSVEYVASDGLDWVSGLSTGRIDVPDQYYYQHSSGCP